jgi:SAM-dependent methyltransferase
VIASDVGAEMLAACSRRARAAAVDLDLRELDMHDLRGIADSSADAVTLSFALMFSPDPVKVMSEIRRVLKPGGRFALAVWAEPAKNPFFTTMFGTAARLSPPAGPPPAPDAPGPFRLAPPGELERVIGAAGLVDVMTTELPFDYNFDSLEHHWQVASSMAPPIQSVAESGSATDIANLRHALAEALRPYMVGNAVRIAATPRCATGRR